MWPFLTPFYLASTLDLTQDPPLFITQASVRLLVNDLSRVERIWPTAEGGKVVKALVCHIGGQIVLVYGITAYQGGTAVSNNMHQPILIYI